MARQGLYIENPAYDKGPDSTLPIQTAHSLPANPTPASTSGVDVSPDTGAHAYIDGDSKEEEENKNSLRAGGCARRVLICGKPQDVNMPSYKEEVIIVDKDNHNNDEIDVHAFANSCLRSKTSETAAHVEGYSHIVINSKSREEELQDSEDDKLITHDACVNPPGSKKSLITEGTLAYSNDYDHITFNTTATEGHLQRGKPQQQDDGNNPPTNENAVGKTTGMAAHTGDCSHDAINCGVEEELVLEVQTSIGEANILDVDPHNRIQTSIQNDETEVVYENAFEKTVE